MILTSDTDLKPLQNMNEDALKVYFDTEINHILDKIKGIKTQKPDEPYRDTLNPETEPRGEEPTEEDDIGQLKEDMISAKGSGEQRK